MSSYTDRSGLFTTDRLEEEAEPSGHTHSAPPTSSSSSGQRRVKVAARSEAEEEEELLYGDIEALIRREK